MSTRQRAWMFHRVRIYVQSWQKLCSFSRSGPAKENYDYLRLYGRVYQDKMCKYQGQGRVLKSHHSYFGIRFWFLAKFWFLTKILIQNPVQTIFTKFSIQFWSLPNRFLTKMRLCSKFSICVRKFIFLFFLPKSRFLSKISIPSKFFIIGQNFRDMEYWTCCEIFWTLGKGQRKIDFQLGKWGDHWLSITVWFRLGGVVLLVRLY